MTTKTSKKQTSTSATVHATGAGHAAHSGIASTGDASAGSQTSSQPAATSAGNGQTADTTAAAAADPMKARIDQVLIALAIIPILLGSVASPATPLSIDERRALPKMKKGGADEMPKVLDLADRYGLVIPGGGTAEARADMLLVALLKPLLTRLTAMVVLVSDAIAQAQGRAWDTTTTAYVMLVRLVRRFPALQTELDSMASFMARVHKDAPTVLRPAEAGTLSRSRATLKAKKDKAASATPAPSTPTATPVAQPAPAAAEAATNVAVANAPAPAPAAGTNGANGSSHS